jgi:hypothetical protein
MDSLQSHEFHAPPHPLVPDAHPLAVAQFGMHAAHSVGLPRCGVDRSDGVDQLRIVTVTARGRPTTPFVEA